MKREFSDYEKYVEMVLNAFIHMQSLNIELVEWDGESLDYKFQKAEAHVRDGDLVKETREYNKNVAIAYMKKHMKTFYEYYKQSYSNS